LNKKQIPYNCVSNDIKKLYSTIRDYDPSLKPTKAHLILKNGKSFQGYSFGYKKSMSGEVVFNTGLVGYTEALTDPSYCGQILTLTYPLIGNYGVPNTNILDEYGLLKNVESNKIHVNGLIVQNYTHKYSHWNAVKSLSKWLREEKIPALYGIDTRMLTKMIRSEVFFS
jgi:carbamoyl-phosphate synthase small subunit